MFDYIGLDAEKKAKLEGEHPATLAAAGLMITNGVRNGILTEKEALTQLHNLMVAILEGDL